MRSYLVYLTLIIIFSVVEEPLWDYGILGFGVVGSNIDRSMEGGSLL
jgi:hypothetical protein